MGFYSRWVLEALAARVWWRWFGPTVAWLLIGLGWLVVVALWLMVGLGLLLGFASGAHRWGEVLACALLGVGGAAALRTWARRLRQQEDAEDQVPEEEPIAVDDRPADPGFERLADAYLRGVRYGYGAGRDDAQTDAEAGKNAGGGPIRGGTQGSTPPPRAVVRELPRPPAGGQA
jgi:hypothetical protein